MAKADSTKYKVKTVPAVFVESETGYRGVCPNNREAIAKAICDATHGSVESEQLVFGKGDESDAPPKKGRGGK